MSDLNDDMVLTQPVIEIAPEWFEKNIAPKELGAMALEIWAYLDVYSYEVHHPEVRSLKASKELCLKILREREAIQFCEIVAIGFLDKPKVYGRFYPADAFPFYVRWEWNGTSGLRFHEVKRFLRRIDAYKWYQEKILLHIEVTTNSHPAKMKRLNRDEKK